MIRAGYNEITLSTDVPSLVEMDSLGKYKAYVSNMSGEPAKSRVERKIYRFDENPKINYLEGMNRRVNMDRQLLSDNELKQLFPAYSFETQADRLKHKTLVYKDVVSIDDEAPFYPGSKKLQPGKY